MVTPKRPYLPVAIYKSIVFLIGKTKIEKNRTVHGAFSAKGNLQFYVGDDLTSELITPQLAANAVDMDGMFENLPLHLHLFQ
ncbi:MAG: hypothetical protein IPO03_21465 [Bacteroidetes bacterium]|nr:hypothetical protein [Bacteroidota bacterium]